MAAVSTIKPVSCVASCVFGDSTPFPYEGNFIETIRHAVDCGVALLASQHAIERAVARVVEIDRARSLERARLETMHDTIRRALATEMASGQERVLRAGSRVLDAARVALEGEVAGVETLAAGELARARKAAEDARAAAARAVETFLVLHEVPGTEIAIRAHALEDDEYAAVATLVTPFGVEATFALQIPDAHEWGAHRRVADLSPGTEVHVPLESGLFFKKVAVQPVKLDRYFVSAFGVGTARSTITLRRQPCAGAGYKLDFDATGERTRVLLTKLGEDGGEVAEPTIELRGEDAVHLLRLRQRVIAAASDLANRRQSMTRASFEDFALKEHDQPRAIAERLVRCLASTVREIARRSGAPGELVLRRDVRAGRRDEVYITTAELKEKILTLPPLLRATFDPFELDAIRSPRAPAASVPAFVDVSDDAIEEIRPIAAA
jgi:hypothetical protein